MVLTVIIKNYYSSKWKYRDLRNDLISEWQSHKFEIKIYVEIV